MSFIETTVYNSLVSFHHFQGTFGKFKKVEINRKLIDIPFDEIHNSTRVSSDANGMYFIIDTSNLTKENSYVVDVMLILGNTKKTFKSISCTFKVSDTQVN